MASFSTASRLPLQSPRAPNPHPPPARCLIVAPSCPRSTPRHLRLPTTHPSAHKQRQQLGSTPPGDAPPSAQPVGARRRRTRNRLAPQNGKRAHSGSSARRSERVCPRCVKLARRRARLSRKGVEGRSAEAHRRRFPRADQPDVQKRRRKGRARSPKSPLP
ncbi:hypothetical protein OH77DRAFT_1428401 [Trametes cingulata]|nr:hypothetical protein OH77DRAFT_1428401 [Trametes cingulata]